MKRQYFLNPTINTSYYCVETRRLRQISRKKSPFFCELLIHCCTVNIGKLNLLINKLRGPALSSISNGLQSRSVCALKKENYEIHYHISVNIFFEFTSIQSGQMNKDIRANNITAFFVAALAGPRLFSQKLVETRITFAQR